MADARMRALMRKRGRKWLTSQDVRLCAQATRDNAKLWAYRLNTHVRDLTPALRQQQVIDLDHVDRWTQPRIAKATGYTQARVSQILKAEAERMAAAGEVDETDDGFREGEDGELYQKLGARPEIPAWSDRGKSRKMITKTQAELKRAILIPMADISAEDYKGIRYVLAGIIDSARELDKLADTGLMNVSGDARLRAHLISEFEAMGLDELVPLLDSALSDGDAQKLSDEFGLRTAEVKAMYRSLLTEVIAAKHE